MLIDLRNNINRKEIPENENPKKVANIVEKILPSDLASVAKVSNCKHVKILTPKQMLQKLPIALAQVKAANTSEN